ncbi:hypothetical protein TNCV_474351 [Trichonephila clavipes]|nr:hypothetical protein TNCV_474351 [Trichonephila clavipes]
MSDSKVTKWARELKDGRTNFHDEERSGRFCVFTDDDFGPFTIQPRPSFQRFPTFLVIWGFTRISTNNPLGKSLGQQSRYFIAISLKNHDMQIS